MPIALAVAFCLFVGTSMVLAIPALTRAELAGELFVSNDVKVFAVTAGSNTSSNGSEWTGELGLEQLSIDYRPNPLVDAVRREVQLNERISKLQLGYRTKIHDDLEIGLRGWFRKGFGHYSSVWINEYYRQQFGTFAEYEEARPFAGGGEISFRRPVLHPTTFLEGGIGWSKERIAPGYERIFFGDTELVRGPDQVSSITAFIICEGWLSSNLRTRHEVSATGSELRPPRYSYSAAMIWATAPVWTVRGNLDATADGSKSRALALQKEVFWEWKANWFWSLKGRYYQDNGGVEDALATFSSAAPPLTTKEVQLSHAWIGDRTSFRVSFGRHFARYCDPSMEIAPFLNLYSDRNWTRIQLVASRYF